GWGGGGAEGVVDGGRGVGWVETPRDPQTGVGRNVEGAKEPLHVIEGGGLEIRVRADDRAEVGVRLWEEQLHQADLRLAVGRVLRHVPALVPYHEALVVKLELIEAVEQRGRL